MLVFFLKKAVFTFLSKYHKPFHCLYRDYGLKVQNIHKLDLQ